VLALLYGLRMCLLGPPCFGCVRTWFGRGWRITHPGGLLANQRGGSCSPSPSAAGHPVAANQFPLSLLRSGKLSFVGPERQSGGAASPKRRFFPSRQVREIQSRGKKVRSTGEILVKCGTPTFAEHLAQQLRQIHDLPAPKRGRAIGELLKGSLDTKALNMPLAGVSAGRGPGCEVLRMSCCVSIRAIPLLSRQVGLSHYWLFVLMGLLALTVTAAVLFHPVHKTFFPAAEDARFAHFMMVLLWPVTAIRAMDLVGRPLLETFHPLAVAKMFCAEERFREFAGVVLRELRHPAAPVCPRGEPAAQAVERESRLAWQAAVEKFLQQSGLEPKALLEAPARAEAGCQSYCPHCLAQFTARDASARTAATWRSWRFPPQPPSRNERGTQAGIRKLARSWMRHDAAWLEDYLVASVEDPRLNLQSILTRHFLVTALTGDRFVALMEQEYRFAAGRMNWLKTFAERAGAPEDFASVLHALRPRRG